MHLFSEMAGVKVDLFVVVHVSNYEHSLEETWQQIEMIKCVQKSDTAKGENLGNYCSRTIKDNRMSLKLEIFSQWYLLQAFTPWLFSSMVGSVEWGALIHWHLFIGRWKRAIFQEEFHLLYNYIPHNSVTRIPRFILNF